MSLTPRRAANIEPVGAHEHREAAMAVLQTRRPLAPTEGLTQPLHSAAPTTAQKTAPHDSETAPKD